MAIQHHAQAPIRPTGRVASNTFHRYAGQQVGTGRTSPAPTTEKDMTHDSPSQPAQSRNRLVPLSSAPGFRLAPGEPDIRGWGLFANNGDRIGTVEELLIDPSTDEVRALLISKTGAGAAGSGGGLVFPIEHVSFDEARHAVMTDITAEAFRSLRSYELDDQRSQATAPVAETSGQSRSTQTSATVERTADGEQVIRVPIVEEQLVVERRPVVKEVVVIRKRAVQESRVIDADLRKERLEIDRT